MKVVLLHPTGNQNVRAVIKALQNAGMLSVFNTTLAVNEKNIWLKLLPGNLRREWLRRTFQVPANQLATRPGLELARIILPKIGLTQFMEHEYDWASIDSVYKDFDKTVSQRLSGFIKRDDIKAVYAYEDGALETFKRAKSLGLKCIYDLPIAYWELSRRLMMEEAERLPAWAGTLGGGIKDSAQKLDRKVQELELADVVVGPGKFVMDSLPKWASNKKMIMSPFGSPVSKFKSEQKEDAGNSKRPLRVLFVGSMGQRKGLGDLFAAIRLLKRDDIQLIVMGTLMAPMEFYKNELPGFIYEPGRPNEQVLELMRSCDVFCLPSIVEGRALVMQEAMSQGLPLIITPNTGGEDLIIEGKTGFLIPIRNPEAIAEKLAWFLDNRSHVAEMGKNAQEHAAAYSWENYGSHIINSMIN